MFYSHDVLSSRKYGVATVWLVATLGSKSSLKKVSRKAILDVDVSKACETIGTPEAPLALRLQSNLLYGVTRVYAQQCGYVLNDVEAAKNSMRMMFKVVQTGGLDAEGGTKGRSEQLMLQDDPNFLPEFDMMPMDLEQLELDVTSLNEETQRSTLSPHHSQQLHYGGIASQEDIGGLIVPESASSFVGGPVGGFGSMSVHGDSGAGRREREVGRGLFEDDLGLQIDEDGNLMMIDEPVRQSAEPLVASERLDRGSVSSRLLREQDGPGLGDDQVIAFGHADDDGFVPLPDDDFMFDQPAQPATEDPQQPGESVTSEETAQAPLRRHRQPVNKPVPVDQRMELRNGDLARWSAEYLANMKEAVRKQEAGKAHAVAKKNAEIWMLGAGANAGPLGIFQGAALLEALTGINLTKTGQKHPRDEYGEPDDGRRVRARGEHSSDEVARGQQEDGFMPFMGDDTIEQGRDAPIPLDDRHFSSLMPWNQSAGSRRPTGLFSGANQPTSASFGGPQGMLPRRGSRLTSASPLMGRGTIGGDIDELHLPPGSDVDIGMTGADDFELFGPAANVDTQTAAQSQWQRAVLDTESKHFLEFVQTTINEQQLAGGKDEDASLQDTIEFETLLPPESHTRVVAAQGLLHVLALGTKNLLSVQQSEAYEPITMQVTAVA